RSESHTLLSGESQWDGRAEISLRGAWGRGLDEHWDMSDASVVSSSSAETLRRAQ
ncbi:hypothetical protein KIL84_007371, partial [Mauremys mutica]